MMTYSRVLTATLVGSAVVLFGVVKLLDFRKQFDSSYEVTEEDIVSDLPGAQLHLSTPAT
jgi:hypothetical protein